MSAGCVNRQLFGNMSTLSSDNVAVTVCYAAHEWPKLLLSVNLKDGVKKFTILNSMKNNFQDKHTHLTRLAQTAAALC